MDFVINKLNRRENHILDELKLSDKVKSRTFSAEPTGVVQEGRDGCWGDKKQSVIVASTTVKRKISNQEK